MRELTYIFGGHLIYALGKLVIMLLTLGNVKPDELKHRQAPLPEDPAKTEKPGANTKKTVSSNFTMIVGMVTLIVLLALLLFPNS